MSRSQDTCAHVSVSDLGQFGPSVLMDARHLTDTLLPHMLITEIRHVSVTVLHTVITISHLSCIHCPIELIILYFIDHSTRSSYNYVIVLGALQCVDRT